MTTAFDSLTVRKNLRRFVDQYPDRPVVLVGSRARNSGTHALSDIDILVVDETGRGSAGGVFQVVAMPLEQLRTRAIEGDDFVQWALRFGVPISARPEWWALRDELLPQAPWPDPSRSGGRGRRALGFAQELLQMGDIPAAEEQALLGVSHLARGALLNSRLFPLSRPELPEQLESIGELDLARNLGRLLKGGLARASLSKAILSAMRWLGKAEWDHRASS